MPVKQRVGEGSKQRGTPGAGWISGYLGGRGVWEEAGASLWKGGTSDAGFRTITILSRPGGMSGATTKVQEREGMRLNQQSGSRGDRRRLRSEKRQETIFWKPCSTLGLS